MQINSIYFPGWQAYELVEGKWEELELGKEWVLVDKELNKLSEKDIVGTTQIKVGPGKRQYKLEFGETPLRAIGNYLSVAGLVTAGGLIYSGNKLAHQEKGKRSDKKKSKNG
jgi:hypothetical protein